MPLSITGIILAKNEEEHIAKCIKSINFCDEIMVIDDYSTDKTVEVINELDNKKVKIISHALSDDFSQSRNFGLDQAQNEWILFVDADERISEALAFEISNVLSNWINGTENEYGGFYIKRFDSIWGKKLKYGESGIKLLRLAKKNSSKWEGKVHEEWKIKGKIGTLNNSIIHYPHRTTAEFLERINFYTDLRAKELYSKKIKTNMLSIVLYASGKFVLIYLLKRGFLDGISGLVYALLMSLHSFLVRGKLWLLWNKK